MKIEAITVCVDYADYLRHTLPINKSLFDRTLVVTTPTDYATHNTCRFYNVEYYATNSFYVNGDKFNKGRAINEALRYMDFREWMVHLDVDIVLPSTTRSILEQISLSREVIYGIDRMMVPNYNAWQQFLENPLVQHEMAYIHTGPFPIGTRIMKMKEASGYIPLGFFQLFHRSAVALSQREIYPTEWDTAATSDIHFAYRWPRQLRQLLPEIICYHLATDDITNATMGQNWEGRHTSSFKSADPFMIPKVNRYIHPGLEKKTRPSNEE